MGKVEFLNKLIERNSEFISKAKDLLNIDVSKLHYRNDENSWNILEVIEHLNLYAEHYLPEIEHKLAKAQKSQVKEFKKGILGAYFSKSMLPKDNLNKMKTFKDKNPIGKLLNSSVIEDFIKHQEKIIILLNISMLYDLEKIKIETSISRLIKINLGDTFMFYSNHIQRHFVQIENYLK